MDFNVYVNKMGMAGAVLGWFFRKTMIRWGYEEEDFDDSGGYFDEFNDSGGAEGGVGGGVR